MTYDKTNTCILMHATLIHKVRPVCALQKQPPLFGAKRKRMLLLPGSRIDTSHFSESLVKNRQVDHNTNNLWIPINTLMPAHLDLIRIAY